MHVGNGAVTPECAAISAAVAVGGLAALQTWLPRSRSESTGVPTSSPWTLAAAGAGVFAAQMINVPVSGVSSAHFVGGVWLAWAFGPRLGALLMTIVLSLQALLLGDGGVLALGCNVINMALVPAGMMWLVGRWTKSSASSTSYRGLALASWFSVVVGAGLVTMETAIGRSSETLAAWPIFATKMLSVHAVAGLIEAAVTVALIASLQSLDARKTSLGRIAIVSFAVALLLAGLAPLVSSALPDGYEFAAEQSRVGWLLGEPSGTTSLANVAAVQATVVDTCANLLSSESLVGLIATLLVAGGAASLTTGLGRNASA